MTYKNPALRLTLAGAMVVLASSPAHALDDLLSPYVEQGVLKLGYFGTRDVDSDNARDDAQKHKFSASYGVLDWWKTKFSGTYTKAAQENLAFDSYEFENTIQLTGKNEYLVDVGVSLAYEWKPQTNRADTAEARLLLAKDIFMTSHLLNLKLEKDVGAGPKNSVEGALLWSSRLDLTPLFQPGFEISSDFGELERARRLKEQEHYIGPAAYGKIPLKMVGELDGLQYRVGYLFGVSDPATNGQAFAQLEYEISF